MLSWTEVAEIIRAVSPAVTASAACFAAWIGYTGLTKWQREVIGKRRTELAEDVLSNFYEAAQIIRSVRSPLAYGHEAEGRVARPGETDGIKRLLDAYFVPLARLEQHQKFFADLRAKRYRMKALFGSSTEEPFDKLNSALVEISVSASMLMRTAGEDDDPEDGFNRRKHEARIWEDFGEDEIGAKVQAAVQTIESMCRPLLEARGFPE